MTHTTLRLVAIGSLAVFLASCASEAPPPVATAPVVEEVEEAPKEPVYTATPGLSDRDRFRKAVAELETGNVGQAKAELEAYLESIPNSSLVQGLLAQINTPIEDYYPAESFDVTMAAGESLSTLAKQYLDDPLQFFALARYNGIDNPSQVSAGQTLRIPATAGALAAKDQPKQEAPVTVADDIPADTIATWEGVLEAERNGDSAAAVAMLNRMTITDPAEAASAANIYMDYAKEIEGGDKAQAARHALEAGSLWLNVANDADDAMTALSWALTLDSDLADAKDLLGRAQASVINSEYRAGLEAYNKQDLDGAISHWNKVLEINPDHTNAQLYKAQAQDLKEKLSSM